MLNEAIEEIEANLTIKNNKQTAKNLINRYLTNFSAGVPLVCSYSDALVYASIRMRPTYEAIKFALNKIIINEENINSAIDVGCGTGAGIVALFEKFDLKEIDGIEINKDMLDVCKKVIKKLEIERSCNVNLINTNALLVSKEKQYDVVLASYFLNELKPKERQILVEKLFCIANKYLIIVEPGTPKNFLEMQEIKNILDKKGAKLVSPCKTKICPLLSCGDWCHFLTRVNRSKTERELKQGTQGYEDEKFSFLIFKKGEVETGLPNIILRRPEHKKNRVDIKVCTPNGIENLTITKSQKEDYKKIKALKVGDEF